jgi:Skp family chaperone for outer membrane proteins
MMRRRFLSIATFLTIALALLFPTARAAEAQSIGTVKIAVIQPAKIFDEMQEQKDHRAKMETEGRSLKAIKDERDAKLKQLEAQLTELRRDSPSYVEKSKELLSARTEAEVWARLAQQNFEGTDLAQTLAIFRKIEAAAAAVAKAKGIDVVFADVQGALPENLDPRATKQALMQFLTQKSIWYTAGAADLTSDVLAKLDADYKAGGNK